MNNGSRVTGSLSTVLEKYKNLAKDAASTGDYVGVDRFKISEDTDGSYSTQRHTMSNAEFNTTGFGYALQANCTGTDASIGATQTSEITQKIEAQNLQRTL